MARPRSLIDRPIASKSSARPPTPSPSVSRPPDIASRLAAAFASHTGGYSGVSRIPLIRPIRDVAPAATASEVMVS
jgi:hypothetical protein